LAEQLSGHKVGESIGVNVQEQDFELKLTEIKEMEKPDLEELASTLEKDNKDELVDEIKSQLQERLDQDHLQKTRYKVLDAIIELADVPVPPRLKDEVIEHELNALARSGRVGAISDDDRSAYAEGAEERLKREVALESIKRQNEDLKLSDDDFETILNEAAEEQNMNATKFKALLERDNSLQRFRSQKEDERVLDYLVEQVDMSKPKAAKAKAKPKTKSDDDADKKPAKKAAAKSSAKKPAAKKTTAKKPAAKKTAAKKPTTKTKAKAEDTSKKESSE
jgi:trigger factor